MAQSFASVLGVRPTKLWQPRLKQLGQQHLHRQRTSVAIHPIEVLHQSGITMVNGTLGPLTATEAQLFNDVVGGFGPSDGGIDDLGFQCCVIHITLCYTLSWDPFGSM